MVLVLKVEARGQQGADLVGCGSHLNAGVKPSLQMTFPALPFLLLAVSSEHLFKIQMSKCQKIFLILSVKEMPAAS